jgi:hypothetical protein
VLVILNAVCRAAGQAQVRFVNQGGRLQGMICALTAQVLACNKAQFFINERQQIVQRPIVSTTPFSDQIVGACFFQSIASCANRPESSEVLLSSVA